ncbi:MAG: cell division protein FtsQ [Lachnospiraceae bacterium]|nr:cell division protein FtsQ [Lachnospiraceae bacterium]
MIRTLTVLFIVAAFVSAAAWFFYYYTVDSIVITGNSRYTDEQIRDLVFDSPIKKNSLYLYLVYNGKPVTDIPFIEKMDITIVSHDQVKIDVYEKAVAGYVKYLGQYIYFDREGYVIETTGAPLRDVPYVTGLEFDNCVRYEVLPVRDKAVFSDILSLTQLFDKYDLHPDRIYFSKTGQITLYFGEAKVLIGTMDEIDEKMMKLKGISPKITGLSGTLRLDDYTEDGAYITFEKD